MITSFAVINRYVGILQACHNKLSRETGIRTHVTVMSLMLKAEIQYITNLHIPTYLKKIRKMSHAKKQIRQINQVETNKSRGLVRKDTIAIERT